MQYLMVDQGLTDLIFTTLKKNKGHLTVPPVRILASLKNTVWNELQYLSALFSIVSILQYFTVTTDRQFMTGTFPSLYQQFTEPTC